MISGRISIVICAQRVREESKLYKTICYGVQTESVPHNCCDLLFHVVGVDYMGFYLERLALGVLKRTCDFL